jgi:hypothetical protein
MILKEGVIGYCTAKASKKSTLQICSKEGGA